MFLFYISNTWLLRTKQQNTHTVGRGKQALSLLPVYMHPVQQEASGSGFPTVLDEASAFGLPQPRAGESLQALWLQAVVSRGDIRCSNLSCSVSVGKAVKQRWLSQAIQAPGKAAPSANTEGGSRSLQEPKEAPHAAGEQDISTQCNHLYFHQAQAPRGNPSPILYFPL